MNTRKKAKKTVYKEDESEDEDFSESPSEAEIPDGSSDDDCSSGDDSEAEFVQSSTKDKPRSTRNKVSGATRAPHFAKRLLSRLTQREAGREEGGAPALTVKLLKAQDKLLPEILNLSESDSSDEDAPAPAPAARGRGCDLAQAQRQVSDNESEQVDFTDINWTANTESSEEVAKKSFQHLKKHSDHLQQVREKVLQYQTASTKPHLAETNVQDLLALGEEEIEAKPAEVSSGSEVEDWEEVKDSKPISQSGIQLVLDFPGAAIKKSKEVDVEMMMRRKINRVKKEYQVYMHKVHVLCWLGHGNYISRVLNDEEILAAALRLLPSEQSYPKGRVDSNYIISISKWYRSIMKLVPDKHENKFKPKAPPLKEIIIKQIHTRVVSSTKTLCYIFICLLRALGIQARVMLNFVTVPIRPPSSELCSLATKHKMNTDSNEEKPVNSSKRIKKNSSTSRSKSKIDQLDGTFDNSSSTEYNTTEDYSIMQLDGNDDAHLENRKRVTRNSMLSLKSKDKKTDKSTEDEILPSKRKKISESDTIYKTKKKSIKTELIGTVSSEKKQITKSDICEASTTRKTNRENTSLTDKAQSKKCGRNKTPQQTIKGDELSKCISETKAKALEQSINSKNSVKKVKRTNENKVTKTQPSKSAISKDKVSLEVSSEFFEAASTSKISEVPKLQLISSYVNVSTAKLNKHSLPRKHNSTSLSTTKDHSRSNETKSTQKPTCRNTKKALPSEQTSVYFDDKPTKVTRSTNKDKDQQSTHKRICHSTKKALHSKQASICFDDKPDKVTRSSNKDEDSQRVSHRELHSKTPAKRKKLEIKGDLKELVKDRIREAKVKAGGKIKKEDSDDSDYAPVQTEREASSEQDFKPKRMSLASKDRRVLSSDDEGASGKSRVDVWCEVHVEEEEQWIPVDVVKPLVHCADNIYKCATHPVCYVVGWDNNNYLKDLTRRYVPQWNTATRKVRAEVRWWETALRPWLGQPTARDREEDGQLDKIMFDAPLPKVIAEYKKHPLYALQRHLLKFEVLHPPDAPALGWVRGEPVFARACVHVCRSRDTWLKEAKTVRLGEKPCKVVKARPKWDRLSNRAITDKPLEIFGPWQVQDYEPPTAEGGVVPRNAYGNVELFKDCMLPKGTVHIKLAGLSKVAKRLNIDCAPAMTGFDFNGGWSHPVYDGFVVCEEFEQILTDAWLKDQEEMERKEQEKMEARVYGNWKKLIKGLLIRERLQEKYAFDNPQPNKIKKKQPRLVVKK